MIKHKIMSGIANLIQMNLPCLIKGKILLVLIFLVPVFSSMHASAQKQLEVNAVPYPGKDPVMWDGVYAASDGKVYSGLITEGASAHFYVYDPTTGVNILLADMAEFLGSRGKGVRTPGKIHNKPVEDNEGYIYFVPMNNGSGPRNIDFRSWEGGHWIKYDPGTNKMEDLGLVDQHVGCYPLAIDKERKLLFGVGFNGYLYKFDIDKRITTKLARVTNWDITRDIFCDDKGNVYGSFPTARIWKYEAETGRVTDLDIRQPYDPSYWPTQMSNPMIDRSMDWRAVEWDTVYKVTWGITCGTGNTLFRFDPHQGPQGQITAVTRMCDPKYWGTDNKNVPYSPLSFGIDSKNQKVYFVPSAREYNIGKYEETFGAEETHHLIMYDIASEQRIDLGEMVTSDGRRVFGCEGISVAPDGTVYIVGEVEVKNREDATRTVGRTPIALQLVIYKPE